MFITNDIIYVGVNDKDIAYFEAQYPVNHGMSYNSYLINDKKIAVMDSVDKNFKEEWLSNIEKALDGRLPDYLVVQHMEPDHSSNIISFLNKYTNAVLVTSSKSLTMLKNFYGNDYPERRIAVSEGDKLELGNHTLNFINAPMVHWPEVIMTYDSYDKVFFSADAFGKFGTLDTKENWLDEARRYYFGIVGKYGVQVQNVLKKIFALDIKIICSLHGPVLNDNINYYINLYNTWSLYSAEKEGVAIIYTSIYGNTRNAVNELERRLLSKGITCECVDLTKEHISFGIAKAFEYSKVVLATTTYNNDVFPIMKSFINGLVERDFKNRTVGFIENGSWAPTAAKTMKSMLEVCKNITFTETTVKINSALNDISMQQLDALTDEIIK